MTAAGVVSTGSSVGCFQRVYTGFRLIDQSMDRLICEAVGVKMTDAPVGIRSSNDELEPCPTLNQSGSPSPDM
jgi:hypothetical protein